MASTEGGMEIEEVAAKTPEKILQGAHRPGVGLQAYQARKLALRARPARRRGQERRRADRSRCTRAFVDDRLLAARGQPAGRDQGRRRRSRSTRRSTSTTTRSSATPSSSELRDLDEEDPVETRGEEVRPLATSARRQHRLHGQRRRPRDGDDGHHQALRRRSRRTSSTSAAAPPRRRSRRRSRSSSPTRR